MTKILSKLRFEYDRGGINHIILGVFEYMFISILCHFPRFYQIIAPRYFRIRASNDICKYDHTTDPFKIEYVDPDQITHFTGRDEPPHLNRRLLFGRVMDGNWDLNTESIEDSLVYQSARSHFLEGTPWIETNRVQQRLENFDCEGYNHLKYKNKRQLLDRYNHFDNLFNKIKTEGYKSQKEISDEIPSHNDLYLGSLDEVTVDIGRNGELLHVDGTHRLIIAKLLDVDKIPVVFLVRHKQWMDYRDKVAKQNDVPDHPDLRDLM